MTAPPPPLRMPCGLRIRPVGRAGADADSDLRLDQAPSHRVALQCLTATSWAKTADGEELTVCRCSAGSVAFRPSQSGPGAASVWSAVRASNRTTPVSRLILLRGSSVTQPHNTTTPQSVALQGDGGLMKATPCRRATEEAPPPLTSCLFWKEEAPPISSQNTVASLPSPPKRERDG